MVFEIRQDVLRDLVVVPDEVAFRVSVLGPIDLTEAGERDDLFPDFEVEIAAKLFRLEGAARRYQASLPLRLRAELFHGPAPAAFALLLSRVAGLFKALA